MEKNAIKVLSETTKHLEKMEAKGKKWIHVDEIQGYLDTKRIDKMTIKQVLDRYKNLERELEALAGSGMVLCVRDQGTIVGYCLPWHDSERAAKLNKALMESP